MKFTDEVYGRTLNFQGEEGDVPTEDEIAQTFNEMYGDDLIFDKLQENDKYVSDLKDEYLSSHGKAFKGDVSDLIEEDFEYWNLIDNSIIAGGSETMFNFKDMSKEQKQRVMRRYDIYNRTNATGEGSRSFFEQLKGVGKGVGLDMLVPGGIGGTMFKFGGKLVGNQLTKTMLKKVLFPGVTGAGWGAGTEYGRQEREIALEARDEVDPEAIQESAQLGAILGPTAPATVKLAGTGVRYLGKGAEALVSKGKREVIKQAAQKKVADTLGGGPVAKQAVVEEGRELIGKGDFEAGAKRAQNTLQTGIEKVEEQFSKRYKNVGNLDMTTDVLDKFAKRMNKDGLDSDNIRIIIGQAKTGNITATDALRKIRTELSNMTFSAKSSRDPALSSKSMLYERWSDNARGLFNSAAQRAGKGKQVAKLDKDFSQWNKFKKEADKLFKNYKDGDKVSRQMRDLIAAPELSPESIEKMYGHIAKIAKNAEDPAMTNKMKSFINGMLKEKLFENKGSKFLKMINSTSGIKGLKMLFPKRAADFDDFSKILKNAGNSPAQFYWGRILAASVAGVAGGSAGGLATGGLAMGATMFMMNNALKSKAFRNMAMNAYRAGKPQPKVINGMVKWLNNKGFDGDSIRDYLLGTAVITGGAALDQENKGKEAVRGAVDTVTTTINNY